MVIQRPYDIVEAATLKVGDEFHWNGDTGQITHITEEDDTCLFQYYLIGKYGNQSVLPSMKLYLWGDVTSQMRLHKGETLLLLYRPND